MSELFPVRLAGILLYTGDSVVKPQFFIFKKRKQEKEMKRNEKEKKTTFFSSKSSKNENFLKDIHSTNLVYRFFFFAHNFLPVCFAFD